MILAGGTGQLTDLPPVLDLIRKYWHPRLHRSLTDDLSIVLTKEHCIQMSERHNKERLVWYAGTANGNHLETQALTQNVWPHTTCSIRRCRLHCIRRTENMPHMKANNRPLMAAGRFALLQCGKVMTGDLQHRQAKWHSRKGERNKLIDTGVLFLRSVVSDYNHKLFQLRLVIGLHNVLECATTLVELASLGALIKLICVEIHRQDDYRQIDSDSHAHEREEQRVVGS